MDLALASDCIGHRMRAGQRCLDGGQQLLAIERLLDEVDSVGQEGLAGGRDVPVRGDDDHRQDGAGLSEASLQFQSRHARHADVDHDATTPVGLQGAKKVFCAGECGGEVAAQAQQQ